MGTDWVQGHRSYECCVGMDRSSPNSGVGDLPEGMQIPREVSAFIYDKHSPWQVLIGGQLRRKGRKGGAVKGAIRTH